MRRCRRLNLTPLCYLWQRNQQELLSEMIDAGMDAILIKVAGIGLTTDHLGKNLVQMEPALLKLVSTSLYLFHSLEESGAKVDFFSIHCIVRIFAGKVASTRA
jgi:diphthine-ammonia ligase